MKDISIVVTGAAGQGIKTVEELLVSILKMSGFNIFANKEYESRIRGGTNSIELRVSSERVAAFVERINILIPLSFEAFKHCFNRVTEKTKILIDPEIIDPNELFKLGVKEEQLLTVNFNEIAANIGNRIFSNVVVSGLISGLFDADSSIAKSYLKEKFQSKGEEIVTKNHEAFDRGFELGKKIKEEKGLQFNLIPNDEVKSEILFNGNEAIALGAIAGGCNFIAAYPMSPSTGVLQFLAAHSEEFGIVVDQAEDEIAAINKTVAAWYAGARALANTSGGGFALMTEGVSLAGITETPIVIHIAQRPGPATGLPTRTAQEDLNLALYAGHGEFCRMIFAPGTIEEAFYLTQKAFNLADKYQIPVFILTDQDFVDRYYNIPELDLSKIEVEKHIIKSDKKYKRYKLTENGLSPRSVPGFGDGLVRVDSDEHDEEGHITEDLDYIRPEMVKKRLFKRMELLNADISPPTWFGPQESKLGIICWGSNFHVVEEAIKESEEKNVAMIHFHQVFPLPTNLKEILSKIERLIILENNATGQFAKVLKLYGDINIPPEQQYLSFNGKPFSVERVLDIIKKEVKK